MVKHIHTCLLEYKKIHNHIDIRKNSPNLEFLAPNGSSNLSFVISKNPPLLFKNPPWDVTNVIRIGNSTWRYDVWSVAWFFARALSVVVDRWRSKTSWDTH